MCERTLRFCSDSVGSVQEPVQKHIVPRRRRYLFEEMNSVYKLLVFKVNERGRGRLEAKQVKVARTFSNSARNDRT